MFKSLGFKIRDNIDDFYDWQGHNGDPAPGTVNYVLNYSLSNPSGTYRYSKPFPKPEATVVYDENGMPEPGGITGPDIRIYHEVTTECPENLRPTGLVSRDVIDAEGW